MAKRRRRGAVPAFGGHDALLDVTPAATLDLHGDTAMDAERRVRDFIRTHARVSSGRVIHVVTGKGRGSAGRPVLPGVVRKVLGGDVARFVAEFDRDLDEAGFLVRLK
jgi:DNA-nicking Smr family endonuclease